MRIQVISPTDGVHIRVPEWTRLLIYWALPLLAWQAWRWRETGSPLTGVILGLLLVLICERYAFGYSVTLYPDRLVYRDRGVLFGRSVSVERRWIRRAVHAREINVQNKPWERVEVEYQGPGDLQTRVQIVAMGGFRSADIDRILQWMPNLVQNNSPCSTRRQ